MDAVRPHADALAAIDRQLTAEGMTRVAFSEALVEVGTARAAIDEDTLTTACTAGPYRSLGHAIDHYVWAAEAWTACEGPFHPLDATAVECDVDDVGLEQRFRSASMALDAVERALTGRISPDRTSTRPMDTVGLRRRNDS